MRVEEVQSTGKAPQCMKKGDFRLSTVLLRPTCRGFQRVERRRLHNMIWLAQPFAVRRQRRRPFLIPLISANLDRLHANYSLAQSKSRETSGTAARETSESG